MLIDYLLNFVSFLLDGVFYLFPSADVASLPYIGSDLRAVLVWVAGVWTSFMETLPYAQIAWHALIYVIVPFEIFMLVLKAFLGQRVPAHLN